MNCLRFCVLKNEDLRMWVGRLMRVSNIWFLGNVFLFSWFRLIGIGFELIEVGGDDNVKF